MGTQNFTAVVEKCRETGLFVGYIPGFPGAHSQGETLDELNDNLREVVGMETEEICKELGISSTNCWVLLYRARLGLQQCLDGRWRGPI